MGVGNKEWEEYQILILHEASQPKEERAQSKWIQTVFLWEARALIGKSFVWKKLFHCSIMYITTPIKIGRYLPGALSCKICMNWWGSSSFSISFNWDMEFSVIYHAHSLPDWRCFKAVPRAWNGVRLAIDIGSGVFLPTAFSEVMFWQVRKPLLV